MKKMRLLICLLAALIMLPGCGAGGSSSLRVCFDLAVDGSIFLQRAAVQNTLFTCGYWKPTDGLFQSSSDKMEFIGMELEFIPYDRNDPQVRLDAIKRVRDEMAAGRGPDVFVCACFDTPEGMVEGGRLFPDVAKAMDQDIFLTLDEYVEDLDIGSHCQQVIAGGRNSEGELVVLPMSFSVPVVLTADGESMDFLPDVNNICEGHLSKPYLDFLSRHPDYAMESRLDENGEVTAQVATYCAVNRNTRRRDAALNKIKFFMSASAQQMGSLYLGSPDEGRMPTFVETQSPEKYYWDRRFVTEEQFKKWDAICKQITHVEFPADS